MNRRRLRRTTTAGALVAAAAVGLGACGGDESSQSAGDKPFNGTDVRFVQKMLPHHMQALRTSEIVIEGGKDPRVKEIAGDITRAQKREIAQMQGFLKEFGAKPMAPPADQKIVWDKNVADERAADSAEQLDTIFLTNMVPHHAAAIPTSQMELDMGRYGPARKLAEQIKIAQRKEIKEMNMILREKG